MADLIITDASEERHIDRVLSVAMDLKLFKNNVTSGLTAAQIEALDETDFIEADFTGYVDVALTVVGWTSTPGDPTVATQTQKTFTSTADQTPQTIYGYYVTRDSDGVLEWFQVFTSPQTIENNGDAIKITPRFTYQDTQD